MDENQNSNSLWFCSIELVFVQTDVTKLSDNVMPGQALAFKFCLFVPRYKNPKLHFCKHEIHLETPLFQVLKNKWYSFHCLCSEQNNKWKYAHIGCVSQHVSYVVNGIHCIKCAKGRKFYVYEWPYRCQKILNLLFCLFLYTFVYLGVQKKSNTGKMKNIQVRTDTVTISQIIALPIFNRLMWPSWAAWPWRCLCGWNKSVWLKLPVCSSTIFLSKVQLENP